MGSKCIEMIGDHVAGCLQLGKDGSNCTIMSWIREGRWRLPGFLHCVSAGFSFF